MAVITISKEFGCDAGPVAAHAAKKLGYEVIGKKLAAEIAKDLNLSEAEVETFKQTSQSRIIRLMDRYTCSLVQKVVDRERGCLDDANYYESTKKLVEKLYDAGNLIIYIANPDNPKPEFADAGRGKASVDVKLPDGEFAVRWFNPRTGGALQTASVTAVSGGSSPSLGKPPTDPHLDWVVLVSRL